MLRSDRRAVHTVGAWANAACTQWSANEAFGRRVAQCDVALLWLHGVVLVRPLPVPFSEWL